MLLQVLSDRAFGKLKERHEIEVHPYRDLSDADEILADVGYWLRR
jgi:hypothetical protein